MPLLVTGADSPLGIAVLNYVEGQGIEVVGTIRSGKKLTRNSRTTEILHLDLEHPELSSLKDREFDAVIHIAAANEGRAEDLITLNGIGTWRLTQQLKLINAKRVIHVSSMSVYGNVEESVVDANTPIRHQSAYGASKWLAECVLCSTSNEISAVSIRAPAIVGIASRRNFLANLADKMLKEEDYIELSNPNFMFNNMIHTENFAEFLIFLAMNRLDEYKAFPVGCSSPIPLKDIVGIIASALNYAGSIKWIESSKEPFQIDSSLAVEYGFKQPSTLATVRRWVQDLVNKDGQ